MEPRQSRLPPPTAPIDRIVGVAVAMLVAFGDDTNASPAP